MKQILAITRKELDGYFGSPLSVIFIGTFLAVCLFVFFTTETFFSRGIADIRPLFTWMPLLLIFLLAALTMRQWSEEQRSGTLEVLLTLPIKPVQLVLGKFLAVMAMIVLALVLTLPLPITVSLMGNLDWGPVFGGYLAAILMASAYAAIGLFVSSRTDNQIVSLIVTILLGGFFYLVGTGGVTEFFGAGIGEILRAIGTGSRFESIQRGIIDLRDLVYYLSLAGIFLTLNTLSLDSKRWSMKQTAYRTARILTSVLVIANLVLVNVWMYPLNRLRADITQNKDYSISQVTRDLLGNLSEPLLLRAYMSNRTHPLLAPLIPQVSDMLREYEIAGNGSVTAEAIDPTEFPELEAEANQSYGIKASPFQIAGRYETSVVNAYFSILVRYGDQSIVLNYPDLIEIQSSGAASNVKLRNIEYDLTRAIKKVVYGFQSIDSILAELDSPAKLTLYVTPDFLPEDYAATSDLVQTVATDIQDQSDGKFIFEVVNPDDPNSPVNRDALYETLGLQPFALSLFSNESFYMHLLLSSSEKAELFYPTPEMTEGDIRTLIESSLKRTSTGFLKQVGFWGPSEAEFQDEYGQTVRPVETYQTIRQQLSQEYSLSEVDLTGGSVPQNIDTLIVVSPQAFTDVELYAVDQFVMRGGSLIVLANPFKLDVDYYQGVLKLTKIDKGLSSLLENYGVRLSEQLVMDNQNAPYPTTVQRNVGGTVVSELQAIEYPYFPEIQPQGMSKDSPIVSSLPYVALNWSAPVELDADKTTALETEVLLTSSANSWLVSDAVIQPDFETYPELGFAAGESLASYPLAVSLQGQFESYFIGKDLPDLEAVARAKEMAQYGIPTPEPTEEGTGDTSPTGPVTMIEKSPADTRIVVIGSSAFVNDYVLQLSSYMSPTSYLNSLQMVQNAVDWSTEDLDLLSIRASGSTVRVLRQMTPQEQTRWEVINYIFALAALLVIVFYWQHRKKNEQPMQLVKTSAPVEQKPGEQE